LYIDEVRIAATRNIDVNPIGNDTYSARQYELKNVGQIAGLGNDENDLQVPEAWNLVSVSNDVVVAVIDAGVELTHVDLNLDPGFDPDGTNGGDPRDPHGTSVAGNVGAMGNNAIGVMGTAPGVRIMPIFMGYTYEQCAAAIDLAVENGADILTNSWGWVGSPSTEIENAINDALSAGRIVLFAAGNGPDRSPFTYDVAFPGNLTGSSEVICVGASSPTDEHKSVSSSDGSYHWGSSYIGDGPDVTAPSPWSYSTDMGGDLGYNPDHFYGYTLIDPADPDSEDYTPTFGGTSSATPKVAGVAALLLSASPGLSPGDVKRILRETADDIDEPGIDDKTGAGRVNAYEAVRSLTRVPRARISFHAGYTTPTGNFNNTYDPGFLAEIDYEHFLMQNLSLELVGGIYRFDPDYNILGSALYLKKYFPMMPFTIFATAGLGAYKPDNINLSGGISAGAGIIRSITRRLFGEIGAYYYRIIQPADDIEFMGLKIGIKYRL
jgi:subtilisin family serine protease